MKTQGEVYFCELANEFDKETIAELLEKGEDLSNYIFDEKILRRC